MHATVASGAAAALATIRLPEQEVRGIQVGQGDVLHHDRPAREFQPHVRAVLPRSGLHVLDGQPQSAMLDPVLAVGEVRRPVGAKPLVEPEHVAARAARQPVVALAAAQRVTAFAAIKVVVALASVKHVELRLAVEAVVACAAAQPVVAVVTGRR